MAVGNAINAQESLDQAQAAAEACWLGLRRSAGIDRKQFQQRFGMDVWERFQTPLQGWKSDGKLVLSDAALHLSKTGIAFADSISASVL